MTKDQFREIKTWMWTIIFWIKFIAGMILGALLFFAVAYFSHAAPL